MGQRLVARAFGASASGRRLAQKKMRDDWDRPDHRRATREARYLAYRARARRRETRDARFRSFRARAVRTAAGRNRARVAKCAPDGPPCRFRPC